HSSRAGLNVVRSLADVVHRSPSCFFSSPSGRALMTFCVFLGSFEPAAAKSLSLVGLPRPKSAETKRSRGMYDGRDAPFVMAYTSGWPRMCFAASCSGVGVGAAPFTACTTERLADVALCAILTRRPALGASPFVDRF